MEERVERFIAATGMEEGALDMLGFVAEQHAEGTEEEPRATAIIDQERKSAEASMSAVIHQAAMQIANAIGAAALDEIIAFFEGPVGQAYMDAMDEVDSEINERGQEIATKMSDRIAERLALLETRIRGQS